MEKNKELMTLNPRYYYRGHCDREDVHFHSYEFVNTPQGLGIREFCGFVPFGGFMTALINPVRNSFAVPDDDLELLGKLREITRNNKEIFNEIIVAPAGVAWENGIGEI